MNLKDFVADDALRPEVGELASPSLLSGRRSFLIAMDDNDIVRMPHSGARSDSLIIAALLFGHQGFEDCTVFLRVNIS
jgi:hypothetical protein